MAPINITKINFSIFLHENFSYCALFTVICFNADKNIIKKAKKLIWLYNVLFFVEATKFDKNDEKN